ncbi:hypothetical protein P3X46_029549 [Hevea brasiliensis]|uniref:Uncharacterized protein n=1 Tax=Hevea brasiliensis TaxID=3981 RepID=A0ABQ9KVN4_HEVBR|nr:hypothetical protein P3X46_029549 [Hevea brasiliensis]
MILDSTGDSHILCLSYPVGGSNIRSHIMHLPDRMKMQKLAILPDISSSSSYSLNVNLSLAYVLNNGVIKAYLVAYLAKCFRTCPICVLGFWVSLIEKENGNEASCQVK